MAKEGLSSSLFSIKELSEKIKGGDITPVDLVEICLNRIKTLNPVLNAFITVIEEQKLYKQAQIAGKRNQARKISKSFAWHPLFN